MYNMVLYRYNIVLEKWVLIIDQFIFHGSHFVDFYLLIPKMKYFFKIKIEPLVNFSQIYLAIICRIIHI